jgi:hypothetical protein
LGAPKFSSPFCSCKYACIAPKCNSQKILTKKFGIHLDIPCVHANYRGIPTWSFVSVVNKFLKSASWKAYFSTEFCLFTNNRKKCETTLWWNRMSRRMRKTIHQNLLTF